MSLEKEPGILDSRLPFAQWSWTSPQIASPFASVSPAAKWGWYYLPTSQWDGRGWWGPEDFKGAVAICERHKVHGLLFKNAQAHWPFKKDRECSCDSSRKKAGAPDFIIHLKREACIWEYFTPRYIGFSPPLCWPLPVLEFD